MTIYEKLLEIQKELKAPKSQYNSFGKYNYRSAEDILEAVKPLCYNNKAVLTLSDDIVLVNERYYVKACAVLTDAEKPESTILVSAYAREEEKKTGMDSSQVTGAASSYARKYALNGLFDIDDTKDSDFTNTGSSKKDSESKKSKAPASEEVTQKIAEIKAEIDSKLASGIERDAVIATLKKACGTAQYTKLTDITKANNALEAVKNMEAK